MKRVFISVIVAFLYAIFANVLVGLSLHALGLESAFELVKAFGIPAFFVLFLYPGWLLAVALERRFPASE